MPQTFVLPRQLAISSSNQLLSGALLYFYQTNTTTPQAVHSDKDHAVELTQPVPADAAGQWPKIYLDPTATTDYRVKLTTAAGVLLYQEDDIARFPVSADEIGAALAEDSNSAELIGAGLYRLTTGEVNAAATPINHQYPPGHVDRYGINAIPNTTDMTAAFSAAFAVAKQTGCSVRWGATAPYRLNGPVNCTSMRGVVVWDESSRNATANAPSVVIAHTGHGFDMSGATDFVFNNPSISNLAGTVPKDIFFCARLASGAGAGGHRFNNLRTPSACTFSHIGYFYGSEENTFTDCFVYNSQPGSSIWNHNGTNTSSYSSTFVTIATGVQSNAAHRHRGGEYYNSGNSGSHNEVVFALENCSNFTFRDGLWYCPEGLCYMRVAGANSSNFLTIDSIRGEPGGSTPTYGIYVVTSLQLNWSINAAFFQCSQQAIYVEDAAEMQGLDVRCSTNGNSGKLLSVLTMSRSVISHTTNTVIGRATGTLANNTFIGSRSSVTLSGTDTANTGFDQATGTTWETGDSYTAASTASTGAITAAAIWSLRKSQNRVTLSLPIVSATATAAASFTFGVTIPAAYRPPASPGNIRHNVQIQDNGNVLNQAGFVLVSTAGVISVFKDLVGTANFTAAAGAGVPGVTTVSWNL